MKKDKKSNKCAHFFLCQFFQIVLLKFLSQKIAVKKIIKITSFYFENFNIYFLKFETLSQKSHPLTLSHKFRLVNTRIKIHILIIFTF